MTRLAFPFGPSAEGRAATHPPGSAAHVRDMLRLVILTMPGERVMRPAFGSPVRQMLFSGGGGIATEALAAALEAGLQQELGHLIVIERLSATFDGDAARLDVDLAYRLRATGASDTLTVSKALP
ncbi:GPW/gp25 family protein [Maritimibacter alexandrii]|uniref:GPW/gp25 family protein n=1 Tax=Maritimibacter alexandrii TaxID=2570355 RepID=UPI001107E2B0|nr:GPW/gp25 family protein [Maritimibacter alexandrii]